MPQADEHWAGDPAYANEPPAKGLDYERSALPMPQADRRTDGTETPEAALRRIARENVALVAENESLRACDCAASDDGNPRHQGYCRSLPTAEKRERARLFAESYATLAADTRTVNALARELADARDEVGHAKAEVEDWRDKWAIVDEDRCEAQEERDKALAEVAALRAEKDKLRGGPVGKMVADELEYMRQREAAERVRAERAEAELAAERARHETTRAAVRAVEVELDGSSTAWDGLVPISVIRAALAAAASPASPVAGQDQPITESKEPK